VVHEIRCHSQFDEPEEEVQAQAPLLFVRFHGILSFLLFVAAKVWQRCVRF
jgi:hypothetical protein